MWMEIRLIGFAHNVMKLFHSCKDVNDFSEVELWDHLEHYLFIQLFVCSENAVDFQSEHHQQTKSHHILIRTSTFPPTHIDIETYLLSEPLVHIALILNISEWVSVISMNNVH